MAETNQKFDELLKSWIKIAENLNLLRLAPGCDTYNTIAWSDNHYLEIALIYQPGYYFLIYDNSFSNRIEMYDYGGKLLKTGYRQYEVLIWMPDYI